MASLPNLVLLGAMFVCGTAAAGASESDASRGTFVVGIDVGHSRAAPGAKSASGVPEYEFNLVIGRLLAQEIRRLGFSTSLLMEEDRALTIPMRLDQAERVGVGTLISIHHDSVQPRYLFEERRGGNVYRYSDRFRGFSVFFSDRNVHAQASRELGAAIGEALVRAGFVPSGHHAEPIPGEGRALVDPAKGLYQFDELAILAGAKVPAVLVECGVIVNRDEERLLRETGYRARLAEAVASGFERFWRGRAEGGRH